MNIDERIERVRDAVCPESTRMYQQYAWDLREDAQALADEVERLRKLIEVIDRTLRVDAAEYVPAIGDVFTLIDKVLKGDQ